MDNLSKRDAYLQGEIATGRTEPICNHDWGPNITSLTRDFRLSTHIQDGTGAETAQTGNSTYDFRLDFRLDRTFAFRPTFKNIRRKVAQKGN